MSEVTTVSSGQRLGKYDLVRRVAQGGMADVYLARQYGIGKFARHVAVKVLNAARAADDDSRAMFLDEARLVALLNHPNVASVLEVDVEDDVHYLAMEYVHGVDLRGLVAAADERGQCLPLDTSLAIVAAAAAGLDHAHRRVGPDGTPLRLVHRDISLSNIMVGHDGSVKVVDFGIAASSISSVAPSPGIVRGKASYMSPEQCLGDDVDLRTDVFALGVVLYELTTGARCFDGPGDFERMLAVVRGDYVPPSHIVENYPADVELVIRTALSTDATKRYPSAAAMIEALEDIARTRSLSLGSSAITRTMRRLFGEVAEPWATLPSIEVQDVCGERTEPQIIAQFADTALADLAPDGRRTAPTVACGVRRRFPAGSMSDISVRSVRDQFDLDDALTSRRRAMSCMSRVPLAA